MPLWVCAQTHHFLLKKRASLVAPRRLIRSRGRTSARKKQKDEENRLNEILKLQHEQSDSAMILVFLLLLVPGLAIDIVSVLRIR